MSEVSYREVEHGSEEYRATVELRRRILRIPLGLDFSEEELGAESVDRHLVAVDGEGNVLGCLVLEAPDARQKFSKMRQVAVEPELQGEGIGSGLVRFSEQVAHDAGAKGMVLHARETARKFYEQLGYGTWEGCAFIEVGLKHWKMGKIWIPN